MLESGVHGYFVLIFIPKFLASITFVRFSKYKCRNHKPELWRLLPVIYCEKCEYEFFEYYALVLLFFRSCLASMAKNNPTEKQTDAEMQATLKHGPA